MEFRHLKYFVTVAAERSFSRASEKLHMAQPPLSRQIKQLEEELGTQLLNRGRPITLTEAGSQLSLHPFVVSAEKMWTISHSKSQTSPRRLL